MKFKILASNNKGKIEEFKAIYKDYNILTMKDIGFLEDIEENGTSFFENALIKAKSVAEYAYSHGYEYPIIAEDSGLEVEALNGEPGIYSGRYVSDHDDNKNRSHLLNKMKKIADRKAHFTCCVVEYFPDSHYIYAYGYTYGSILEQEVGSNGFAYDNIFFSNDLNKSFGEADSAEKNKVSHRARAIENLFKLEQQEDK